MSLFIALVASRSGWQVTIAERSSRLGGAWATDTVDGQIIDRACHLLEPLTPGPRWMFDQLGQTTTTFAKPPLAISPWGSVLPIQSRRYRVLDLAMTMPASFRHLVMAIGGRRPSEVRRVVLEAWHDLGRLSRRAMQEVLAGPSPVLNFSPQPFTRLCELVAGEIEEIRLSTEVECLEHKRGASKRGESKRGDSKSGHSQSGGPQISALVGGVTRQFEQVVLPSGADLEVLVDGRAVPRKQFHFENRHLLFQAVAGPTAFEYVAFMSDRRVRRVVDTGPVGSGYQPVRRFLAHVRSASVDPEQVVERMARHGLAQPESLHQLDRTYRYTSTRTIFTEQLPPGIWAPDTYGDLSDNITRLLVGDEQGRITLGLPFPVGG